MFRSTRFRHLQMLFAAGALLLFTTAAAKAQTVVNLTFYLYAAASLPGIPAVNVSATGACQPVAAPYAFPGASEFSVEVPIAAGTGGNFKIDCTFKVTSAKDSFVMSNLVFDPKSTRILADLTANGGATTYGVDILDGYTGVYPYNGAEIPYAFFYLAPGLVNQIRTQYGINAMYTYASVVVH